MGMNWSCYKTLCDQPDYWPRWFLERLRDLAGRAGDQHLCECLNAVLRGPPLEKPSDHRGDERSDVFPVALAARELAALLELVAAFEAGRHPLPPVLADRGLGGFPEALKELLACRALPAGADAARMSIHSNAK